MNWSELMDPNWYSVLKDEFEKDYFDQLKDFVESERQQYLVFPPEDQMFQALELAPYDQVKVLILGQYPYHSRSQAQGLAFSVPPGVRPPLSLQNILRELHDDLGIPLPGHGNLEAWAVQGVLLLNAVLTVRAGAPASHQGKGWERFTDAITRAVSDKADPVVFVLWGGQARKKRLLIDPRHTILVSADPSPYSADRGFFGSRPFSRINAALHQSGHTPIDWRL